MMARIGAAAFAVGLLLAGPQAAGVAAADRGDAGDSASASDDTRGPASDDAASDDEPGRPGGPEAPSDPATEDESGAEISIDELDEPDGLDEPDESDVEVSIDEPDEENSIDEWLPEIDEPEIKVSIDEPHVEDPTGEALPLLPEEPAVLPVEETGESIPEDTESPTEEAVTEPPAEESTEDVDSSDGDDQSVLDDPVAVEDGVPGRGGPDPLPWWRTTTSGEEGSGIPDGPVWMYDSPRDDDGPVALPGAVPGSSEEQQPAVPIAGAGDGPAGQVLATLKMKVVEVLDLALNWLSGLPSTQFTEFLAGALLLVRRALLPEISQEDTGGPGASELTGELPDGLVGLSEAAAVDAAESGGWVARVVARDGEYYPVTKDYLLSRVNLTVVGGIVTSVSVG
jgi:hypothetical protein